MNAPIDLRLPLILASRSPRRRDLLAAAGIPFEVRVADTDETARPNESGWAYVSRLAVEKALAVATQAPGRYVLGADTAVVVWPDSQQSLILGKPDNHAEAIKMLEQLSGVSHYVLTGVALICLDPDLTGAGVPLESFVSSSRVTFRELTRSEIEQYVLTGEPLDKAGAYAIQGGAKGFVSSYEGSWSNIVGLPIEAVAARWKTLGR